MKKRLRIAFVTNNYTPYCGGVVRSINSFRTELEKQGHSVFIVTLDFKHTTEKEKNVIRIECPFTFQYKTKHMAIPLFADRQVLQNLKNIHPDIIHSHHPFLLGYSALLAANKLKIPIVFTYHSLYEHFTHYVPFPDEILHPLIQYHVNHYCNDVDGIIAPSSEIKQKLEYSCIQKPIIMLPTGLSSIFYHKKLKLPQSSSSAFQLLTVSRFSKEKNIPFLLDVFSQLDQKKFTFTLVGFGPEYEILKNYAYNTLQLSPRNIKFIESPPLKELLHLYRKSNLFIYASYSETQGLVLNEALAAGTPVVSLDGPGQRESINGKNGCIIHTQKEMVQAIVKISSDPNQQQVMQKEAWLSAQNYKIERLTKKLILFYRSFT